MLAFGESGTTENSRNRLMRWRRGEMSGHDLARAPGLSDQKDYRLGEKPMPVRPNSSAQPLFGSKRSCDGLGLSYYADSPCAAPPTKKVRMSEIEIQTAETSETLEKRGRDWQELCAKLEDYKKKAKKRDEWKRKYDELLIILKEEKIRHLKEVYNARVSKMSPYS